MKHKPYTCDACKTETKYARNVAVKNFKGTMCLCDKCNIELITYSNLDLNNFLTSDGHRNHRLIIDGMTGDFFNVYIVEQLTAEEKRIAFWESRQRVYEHAQMSNFSTVGWDCHESY